MMDERRCAIESEPIDGDGSKRSSEPRAPKALVVLPFFAVFPLALSAISSAISSGCAATEEPVRTTIAARFSLPRGLLDKAKQLELRVLEGQVSCDDRNGAIGNEHGAREIAKTRLEGADCAENARFCGDVSIPKSPDIRVFTATASDGSGGVLATGCTSATIDQDAVAIAIRMFRFLPPAVCGDGTIQPTEQCEPGGSDLCDATCLSTEVLLSVGASSNNTSTGKSGDKTDPFFLWPEGSGNDGRFLAFYTDRAVAGGTGNIDVGLRVMNADLSPATTPPAVANGSIFLPNGGAFPPTPEPGRQSLPKAAFLGGKYWVVFQDDNSPGSSGLDIHVRSITSVLQSDQGAGAPLFVNGDASGEAAIQTAPTIGASAGRLLIAWEDQSAGKIVGRTLTPPSTLGNQNDLSTGNGNTRPDVASTPKGWVAVWTSGTGIKLRTINADGTPSGGEQPVNTSGAGAEGGRVASLSDGRFAVVWSKGGDIFVQRYDEKGLPVATDDQTAPLNDVVKDGDQTQPAIAAIPASGGSYVVAWHDATSGHVRARFIGGSTGFLFNNVDGQTSEFQASRQDGHERKTPVVAGGGNVGGAPAVAIGWEDTSSPSAGIVVRRFPLPTD